MAYINLLPWREEAQKIKQQQFYSILAAVVAVAFALMFVIAQIYQMCLDGQKSKNQYLQTEIQKLDFKIKEIKGLNEKKSQLISRIDVIKQLQKRRNVGTQVLNEMSTIVPSGVYLTSLSKQNNMLAIKGKSESNNHLANMIRATETSNLLADAQISSISSNNGESRLLSDFEMQIRIEGLVSDEDLDVAAKGGK